MYAVDTDPAPTIEASPPAGPGRRWPGGRRRRRGRAPFFLSLPSILLLTALLAFPFGYMIYLTFRDMRLRHLINNIEPPWAGLANYTRILQDPVFWTVVRR